jgi:hypothetical protein
VRRSYSSYKASLWGVRCLLLRTGPSTPGIIYAVVSDLNLCRFPTHRAHTIKQMVTLCGPGSGLFIAALSALKRIHQYIDESFSVGVVCGYEISNSAGLDTVVAGTHILTPTDSKVWAVINEGPPATIDPDNVLRTIMNTGKYQYTEDNVVAYSEMITDDMEG